MGIKKKKTVAKTSTKKATPKKRKSHISKGESGKLHDKLLKLGIRLPHGYEVVKVKRK